MVKRGEIYLVDTGRFGYKPMLIVQADEYNKDSAYTIALKLCRNVKVINELHVEIPVGEEKSYVVCDQLATIKQLTVGRLIGKVSDEDMARIDAGVAKAIAKKGE